MRILFTICGRAGSKGIKNKNLRLFCGKPLAYYSLSAIDLYIKKYGQGTDWDIVINSDSDELLQLMDRNPFVKVNLIKRSPELSGDVVGKKDVILDCILRMEEKKGYQYDVAVDLDITSPLRTVEDLAHLVDRHFKTGADITYSVTTARRNPYFNQVTYTEKEGARKVITSEFTSRQQAPVIYDMNASLYAYKPEHLKSDGGFNGGYYEIIEMYDTAVLDLDHENDFELMQVIADYLYRTKTEFAEIRDNIPLGTEKGWMNENGNRR